MHGNLSAEDSCSSWEHHSITHNLLILLKRGYIKMFFDAEKSEWGLTSVFTGFLVRQQKVLRLTHPTTWF